MVECPAPEEDWHEAQATRRDLVVPGRPAARRLPPGAGAAVTAGPGARSREAVAEPEGAIVDADSLEARLKAAGLVLVLDSELPTHYLPGTARIYAVEGSDERLELYRYAAETEAVKAASGISRDGMMMSDPQAPGEKIAVKWPAPPHVYRRGKLLVIYAGSDSSVLETLAAGLGAPIAGAD